jgi:tRNA threonylcarbamoyladenosine biosynthesis protein TsaB
VRILSLDTTTRDGSAAIVEDDRVVDVRRGDASRSHAERLPLELMGLLEAHRLTFADVDVFAVASGPGSFTGLRIGIAAIQGLAFTCGKRVVAVSALEALAQAAIAREPGTWNLEPGTLVVSWMDAHRHEVFSAAFQVAAAPAFEPERLTALDTPRAGAPLTILEEWRVAGSSAPLVFTGDGAVLYADEIARAFPTAHILPPEPLAGVIGLIAASRARRGETIDPAAIQPLYVRRPDAEVARDARGSAT